jgi:FtsH-binding integral membrane protein
MEKSFKWALVTKIGAIYSLGAGAMLMFARSNQNLSLIAVLIALFGGFVVGVFEARRKPRPWELIVFLAASLLGLILFTVIIIR